ncbi:ABC-type Fe3+-citrate transport system substrate-binding protein [Alkalihalobacillus xiaoxiensis]|uniref:ABC-type Fe3+-citrate transport system substrate-binding protein n=1 Tax=Shouchella xiaoxiensis TaxID=766895 RepID=A0ABS2SYZ7_9BACI|nr:hypothetical protein [Shouchella xiaoxiensis]MBM7840748.1 ABC-type Fe3+-citrate transport system substrate-binding protein [Shouchella xiaoxiensis]
MNKRRFTSVIVAVCLPLLMVSACQQNDTNGSHQKKPDGYIEPVPIKIIEEKPVHIQ